MTRQDILNEFTVENGIIRNPGKFEFEPIYAPYFYDAYLNGMADEDDGEELWFDVTDEDRAQFPELGKCTRVICREDSQGFWRCEADGEPA